MRTLQNASKEIIVTISGVYIKKEKKMKLPVFEKMFSEQVEQLLSKSETIKSRLFEKTASETEGKSAIPTYHDYLKAQIEELKRIYLIIDETYEFVCGDTSEETRGEPGSRSELVGKTNDIQILLNDISSKMCSIQRSLFSLSPESVSLNTETTTNVHTYEDSCNEIMASINNINNTADKIIDYLINDFDENVKKSK